jgi:signal transduction histidine kinase
VAISSMLSVIKIRERIGRNLHDSVSQYLSVLEIKLSSLKSL